MRILRARDYVNRPWKNGGGETTEIWVSPNHAGLEAFDWRISMAKVAGDGPFSIFPGIDRSLMVLDGDGLRLAIEGRAPIELGIGADPLAFPADVATEATLVGGPITDLNVMTRRDRLRHRVSRLTGATMEAVFETLAVATLVLCDHGGVTIGASNATARLGARDAALLEPRHQSWRLVPETGSAVILVEIMRSGAA